MVLDGIYTGLPKKMHRPIADGITTGLKKDMKQSLAPQTCKVAPSATQVSVGVFGAGATPQGEGDGRGGSKMKLAHQAGSMPVRRAKKMAAMEAHEAMHNA